MLHPILRSLCVVKQGVNKKGKFSLPYVIQKTKLTETLVPKAGCKRNYRQFNPSH